MIGFDIQNELDGFAWGAVLMAVVITIVQAAFKLLGWILLSWWWVFLPIGVLVALVIVIAIIFLICISVRV